VPGENAISLVVEEEGSDGGGAAAAFGDAESEREGELGAESLPYGERRTSRGAACTAECSPTDEQEEAGSRISRCMLLMNLL